MGVVLRRRLEDLDVRARDLSLAVASTRQRIAYGYEVLAQLGPLLNHPGHADQKSHGRKGGGGKVEDLTRGPVPSIEDAAKGTNPRYGQTASMDAPRYRDAARAGQRWTPEMGPPPSGAFEENCTNTVMAFEMRMRGYDVEAAPLDVLDKYGYAGGRTIQEVEDQLASNWKAADGTPHGRSFLTQEWRSFDKVDREVERDWPEGGRGFITVGKHVFSVVKKRGKARYVESQFDASPNRDVTKDYKKKYGPEKGASEFFSGVAKVIRLDDLVPTDEIFESIVARE